MFARIFLIGLILSILSPHLLASESLEQTIDYLLDHVAKSDATFIRNGNPHTAQEAFDHIKAKYEHFKAQIKTPEDFIRLTASKSLVSGKPYLVHTPDGKEMRLDEWLAAALKDHRAQTAR